MGCALFLLAAQLLPALAAGGLEGLRPNYKPVTPGLDYARVQGTNWNDGQPLSIHIARLDRSQKALLLTSSLAHGEIFGTAPVSSIAASFPRERGEPLVAINAGFCIRTRNPYNGAPRGMVITQGELLSSPALCPFNYNFWVDKESALHFGTFQPALNATLPNGTRVPIGLNHECASNAVVLFTAILGQSTRATNHLELVLERPGEQQLAWHVGETYTVRVKAINPAGNTHLSNSIAVLSFGSERAASAATFKVGDQFKLDLKVTPGLKDVVTACHACFPIVQNGKPLEQFEADGAMLHRNPRTAIGFNPRYFYMVVVDGRQKTLSMGLKARELAEFMAHLGCTEAMNMDGGGSSTFWLEGKTRNSVPGGRERERADILVIAKRRDSLARQ
jgi:hypothetical protein